MADHNNSSGIELTIKSRHVISNLFDSTTADIKFQFRATGQTILADKRLLLAVCPLIKKFYANNFQAGTAKIDFKYVGSEVNEENWHRSDIIVVGNVEYNVFNALIRYFYGHKLEVTVDNVDAILDCAIALELAHLEAPCKEMLLASLSSENVLDALAARDNIRDECKRFIAANTADVLRSESFLRCSPDMLNSILETNSIECSPTQVFDACIEWSKHRCQQNGLDSDNPANIQREFAHCFDRIDFDQMDRFERNERCQKYSSFFTGSQLVKWWTSDLNESFHVGTPRVKRQRPSAKRSESAPTKMWYVFPHVGPKSVDKPVKQTILFSTAKKMELTELSISNLAGPDNLPLNCTVNLELSDDEIVIHSTEGRKTQTQDYCFDFDGESFTIERNKKYTIKVTIDRNDAGKLPLPSDATVNVWDIRSKAVKGVGLKIHSAGNPNDFKIISSLTFES